MGGGGEGVPRGEQAIGLLEPPHHLTFNGRFMFARTSITLGYGRGNRERGERERECEEATEE